MMSNTTANLSPLLEGLDLKDIMTPGDVISASESGGLIPAFKLESPSAPPLYEVFPTEEPSKRVSLEKESPDPTKGPDPLLGINTEPIAQKIPSPPKRHRDSTSKSSASTGTQERWKTVMERKIDGLTEKVDSIILKQNDMDSKLNRIIESLETRVSVVEKGYSGEDILATLPEEEQFKNPLTHYIVAEGRLLVVYLGEDKMAKLHISDARNLTPGLYNKETGVLMVTSFAPALRFLSVLIRFMNPEPMLPEEIINVVPLPSYNADRAISRCGFGLDPSDRQYFDVGPMEAFPPRMGEIAYDGGYKSQVPREFIGRFTAPSVMGMIGELRAMTNVVRTIQGSISTDEAMYYLDEVESYITDEESLLAMAQAGDLTLGAYGIKVVPDVTMDERPTSSYNKSARPIPTVKGLEIRRMILSKLKNKKQASDQGDSESGESGDEDENTGNSVEEESEEGEEEEAEEVKLRPILPLSLSGSQNDNSKSALQPPGYYETFHPEAYQAYKESKEAKGETIEFEKDAALALEEPIEGTPIGDKAILYPNIEDVLAISKPELLQPMSPYTSTDGEEVPFRFMSGPLVVPPEPRLTNLPGVGNLFDQEKPVVLDSRIPLAKSADIDELNKVTNQTIRANEEIDRLLELMEKWSASSDIRKEQAIADIMKDIQKLELAMVAMDKSAEMKAKEHNASVNKMQLKSVYAPEKEEGFYALQEADYEMPRKLVVPTSQLTMPSPTVKALPSNEGSMSETVVRKESSPKRKNIKGKVAQSSERKSLFRDDI